MKSVKLMVGALGGAVLALTGCGSSPMSKVNSETRFEDLMANHLEFFPTTSVRATGNSLLPQEVSDSSGKPGVFGAHQAFNKWCLSNKGRLYQEVARSSPGRIGEISGVVFEATGMGQKPWPAVEQRACELSGKVYFLASTTPSNRQAANIAWFSPEALKAVESAVAAKRAQVAAQKAAKLEAERIRDEEKARQYRAREERIAAEKLRVLNSSPKGTQLTCTSERSENEGIDTLWYSCLSFRANFKDFNQYGWKVAHQSISPGTSSRGYPVAVVSLILERSR